MSREEGGQQPLLPARKPLSVAQRLARGPLHQLVVAEHVGGAAQPVMRESERRVQLQRFIIGVDRRSETARGERRLALEIRLGSRQG
jgi:hypothetical protein